MERKLFHWRCGFIGTFTKEEADNVMNTLGGCFKWDFPFTLDDLCYNFHISPMRFDTF